MLRDGSGPEGTGGADLRLLPGAAAAWAGAGWTVAQGLGPAVVVASILGAASAAALAGACLSDRGSGRGRRARRVSAAIALAAACGALAVASGGVQAASRQAGPVRALVAGGATAEVVALVRSAPNAVAPDPGRVWDDDPRWTVRLQLQQVRGRGSAGSAAAPVLAIGGAGWDELVVGQRISATGRLAPVEPGDDVVALVLARGAPVVLAPPGLVHGVADALREGLRQACAGLPPDARGLLPGLVVGDTSQLPADLERAMRDTGLTHLTAVSGSNITIVCGAGLLVASAAKLPRRRRLAVAAAVLAGFVVLAGPEPSVLRAGVMGAVGLVGLAASRRGAGVPALCVAVVALVTLDPWLARAYGFALSVLATAGLLLLARPWSEAMSQVVPRWLALALAVPLAAQSVCGPVTVLLAPQVPLTALPANMLVAPAVAPATVLGLLATLLAPVSPPAAAAVAWCAGWSVRWVAVVARTAADVPGGLLAWPAGGLGAVLLALLSAALLAAIAVLSPSLLRLRHPGRALAISAAAVAAALVLALTPVADGLARPGASWPPSDWRVVACDVGQGDALVIGTGPGRAIVVDVGPDPGPVDRCLERLGIDRIELLVLTHFHADHVAGLQGALDGRQVDAALVSPQPDPPDGAAATSRALAAAGVPATAAWTGQRGRLGDVDYQVLWPQRLLGGSVGDGGEGSLANDASVVLHLSTAELSVVTTGDIEPPAQRALTVLLDDPALAGVGPVDVVKVAHHGSSQQWPALYERLAPRVALVSAGADNDYGHPSAEALALLEGVEAVVGRTDLDGDVAVGVTGGSVWLVRADP